MARRWVNLVGVTPLLLGMTVSVPQMVMATLVSAQSSQTSQSSQSSQKTEAQWTTAKWLSTFRRYFQS